MDDLDDEQRHRLSVLKRLKRRQLTNADAARILRLSARQVRRLKRAYSRRGEAALVHGNTGRAPANRTQERVRMEVLKLRRTKYLGFNDHHFADELVEAEHIRLSRPSVQRFLRQAGIASPRTHERPKHRARRERRARSGELLLWDGSPHDWLEGRGPQLSLVGAVDDATGELLPGAHFVPQENAAAYLRVLLTVAQECGLPLAIYQDRHSALKRNDDHWTLEEELRGEQDLTHVGTALRTLRIEPIFALSPQAKGRVERMWGTLQDRLCSELRLAKAKTIAEANVVLERVRKKLNRRFGKPARDQEPAWRPVPTGIELQKVCAFRYRGVVGNDNAVRLSGNVIDIPPGPGRRSYAKAQVEIRQFLDGSWRVYLREQLIAQAPPSALEELRPLKQHKHSAAVRAFGKGVRRMRT